MRKSLLVYSHNPHSFLNTEIQEAAKVFPFVVLVCPRSEYLKTTIDALSNVQYITLPQLDIKRLLQYGVRYFFDLFSREMLCELWTAFKKHKVQRLYLKMLFEYFYLKHALVEVSTKLGINQTTASSWVVLSSWYAGTAYAATELKSKYGDLCVASLAHSFEVDRTKNEYVELLYRKHYHNQLDVVSFISERVMESFKADVAQKLDLNMDNCMALHLGTYKLLDGVSRASVDGTIRVLSCSNIIKVKRIDRIFDALDHLDTHNVEWTHVGSGEMQSEIEKLIARKKNKNLKVVIRGRFPTLSLWHQYYIDNHVDVFINVSESEGVPVTLMEAEAYGVPVIATDVGGNSEALEQSFGVLLNEKPTSEEIGEAICHIVFVSSDAKHKMRRNAALFFKDNYDATELRPHLYKLLINT